VKAKGHGWRRGENDSGECDSPKDSADLSHDLARLRSPQGLGTSKVGTTINAHNLDLFHRSPDFHSTHQKNTKSLTPWVLV
jgi:hypothetical protein